jgi:hypothetical protein
MGGAPIGNTYSQGKQNALVWKPYQDEILAELFVTCKHGKFISWSEVKKTALWTSLPDRLKTLTKDGNGLAAKSRMSYLKSGKSLLGVAYWNDLVAKYEKKSRNNFFAGNQKTPK